LQIKHWRGLNGTPPLSIARQLEGRSDDFESMVLTPDGQRATSVSLDQTLAVLEPETGELLASFDTDSVIQTAACAPDGRERLSPWRQT